MFPHQQKRKGEQSLHQREITGAFCTVKAIMFHHVFNFQKGRLEKDLFQSMNSRCVNINCLRYLPTCQKNFSEALVPELLERDINHSSSFISAAAQEEEIDACWFHPKGESSL